LPVKELVDELTQVLTEAQEIVSKADAESRELSGEERATIKERFERGQAIRKRITEAKGDDQLKADLHALGIELGLDDVKPDERPGLHALAGAAKAGGEVGSAADQLLASSEWKTFMSQWHEGHIPEKARVQSNPVLIAGGLGPKARANRGAKTLLTGLSRTSAGALVPPDWQGLMDTLGRQPIVISNLIASDTTTSDLVQFVRQTTRVNAAAPVAEATATGGATGTKPEGGFALEIVNSPVETMAEWIPATRRALADAGQLRGMIDRELVDDLDWLEERQFLYGTGATPQLRGIATTVGIQQQPFDTDIFVTARKALTIARTIGYVEPTAYVFSPEDDEAIDLERDIQGRFYGNGPFQMGPNTLWGRPRLVSMAVPAGEGWLADWRRATVWDREQATISVSDSHQDFFVRNLIAVLAEDRLAFGVIRPPAFVRMTLA
jgi:HK97 family phage major capsid protein